MDFRKKTKMMEQLKAPCKSQSIGYSISFPGSPMLSTFGDGMGREEPGNVFVVYFVNLFLVINVIPQEAHLFLIRLLLEIKRCTFERLLTGFLW